MAKTILIELKGQDNASASVKKTEQAVESLGKKTTKMTQDMGHGATDVMGKLDALGNRFRYMSIVVGALAAGSVALMKTFVDAAREGEQAFMKLGVFAVSVGEDMDETNRVAQELAATGLISVSEAAEGLANFLATGLGLDKATDLMWNFLNSASVAKESITDTLGQALVKTSLGFRTFREVQIDASGINTQLNKVFQTYAKTLDTTVAKLSNAQRYQAMYNFYMQEGSRFTGAAEVVQNTFSGTLSRLNAQLYQMKIALGNTLIPLVGTLSDMLAWASGKVKIFAENSSAMTSVLLVGTTVLATFAASLAMIGAMLPMLVSGFVVLNWAALAPMILVGLKVAAVFLAISVAIGGLVYLVLKATGQWDKWKNSMADLAQKIKDTINPFKQLGDTVTEVDEKIAKQIKKLEKNMALATRDFREDMAEWAKKHDETIKDLTDQINDLQREYSTATAKIRRDFADTMSDLTLSHTRKTEDLQRELDEEVSKGIWADQTRIREIRLALKRENEDYALATQEKADQREESLADEKTKLDERLVKLQAELDEELALEKKHAAEIAEARTWPILDEIEKRTRAFNERLDQYREELLEIQETAGEETNAIDTVTDAFDNLSSSIDNATSNVEELGSQTNEAISNTENLSSTWSQFKSDFNENVIGAFKDYWNEVKKIQAASDDPSTGWFWSIMKSFVGKTNMPPEASMWDRIKSIFSFQTGGIVPGSANQAVPIIAHGGETVLPSGVAPITVNINNPTVRSETDIQLIANAVRDVLSRQQVLRHLT